jgi:hypothetical protein
MWNRRRAGTYAGLPMITNIGLEWALSIVYVIITGYALVWIVRSRSGRDRVSYFAHALMGMAMFAMIWPWGTALFLVP